VNDSLTLSAYCTSDLGVVHDHDGCVGPEHGKTRRRAFQRGERALERHGAAGRKFERGFGGNSSTSA
jgi:hypothetical protein